MAGKLYDGRDVTTPKNGVKKNTKAYCEGMSYRATGTAVQAPKVNNPHLAGSEAATAWDAGWDTADNNAGGTISKADAGPCGAGGVPT